MKIKKATLLNIFLIIILLASIGVSAYLFFYRKIDITQENNITTKILKDTLTDIEAEKLNYDKLAHTNTGNILEEINYFEDTSENSLGKIKRFINWDGEKFVTIGKYSNTFIPIVFSNDYLQLDYQNSKELLEDIIKEFSFKELIFDSSLQSDTALFYKLIEDIKESYSNLKIGVILNFRTAESEKYTNYKIFNPTISKIIDVVEINKIADYIYLKAYDYTPPTSALPGPNSKLSEIEDILQYYISKGISPNKIYLGVNAISFKWPDRLYTNNISENIILDTIQAEEYTGDLANLTIISQSDSEDSVYSYTDNEKTYLITIPSTSYINKIRELALSYNILGLYFRY